MALKLHTENVPGNLHQAAITINSWGWAEYVLAMEMVGSYTVTVFKMPAAKVHEIRAGNGHTLDPHHDDYTGPDDPYASDYRLSQVLGSVEHHVQHVEQEQAKQDAVSSPENPPAEASKQTRKRPQAKPKQETATGNGDSGEEVVNPANNDAGNAVGAAEKAKSSNLPDWAK